MGNQNTQCQVGSSSRCQAEGAGAESPAPGTVEPTEFRPKDFCGNDDLMVRASKHPNREIGVGVNITAGGRGCRFQWSLTPAGAREMAVMLMAAANEADALEDNA